MHPKLAARVVEELEQRAEPADRQRVDQCRTAVGVELDQAELFLVMVQVVGLEVHADATALRHRPEETPERFLGIDDLVGNVGRASVHAWSRFLKP